MVVPTNVRAGRTTALLAGFQSARGTVVSDFTAANTWRLWTEETEIPADYPKSMASGVSATSGYPTAGSYLLPAKPAGTIPIVATPQSVEAVFRSNYGAFAGGTFTLASQIQDAQWMTLGWVENTALGTQRLVRIRDCWFHKVEITVPGRGRILLQASYAGRVPSNQLLNAGGITYPAAPMTPSRVIFPCSAENARLFRDPAGANQALRFESLSLTFDQGLLHEYSQGTGLYEVYKRGLLTASLEIVSEYGDETWTMLANGIAGTKQRYRFIATTENAANTWTIDLYDVQVAVEPVGHDGRDYRRFRAVGTAHVTGSNLVTMTLT